MAYEFKATRQVEFADTDMAGIVHFSRFFRYMEAVEHAMFRSLGYSIVTDIDGVHFGWPRVKADCEYTAPLKFEDRFEVHLLVREVREKALVLDFRFNKLVGDERSEVARGSLVTVCVQRDTEGRMRSVPIPPQIAGQLEPAPAEMLD